MKTYALFANKPDSADYVMSCCVESYPGDSVEERNLTEEELIERIAELKSKPLGHNEDGYSITFFEEPPEIPEEEQNRIQQLIEARTKQLVEKREAEEQAKKEAKKAAERAQAEAAERAQFERLKAKYGGDQP